MHTFHKVMARLSCMAGLAVALSCTDSELNYNTPEYAKDIIQVSFHPSLDGTPASRAIGDAGSIDQLRVGVYQEKSSGLSRVDLISKTWNEVQKEGVNLQLKTDASYSIIFWAEDSDNTAYNFKEDGSIAADYSDYVSAGFSKMEELDAFCAVSNVKAGQKEKELRVVLRRPFAQLNFADKLKPEKGVHTAKVTFHSIPTAFNPITGSIKTSSHSDDSDDITFRFTDFPSEPLNSDGKNYYYVSCNYIFASPTEFSEAACTVELQNDGIAVSHHEFKGKKSIAIEQRKKINMIDYMVPEPEKWSKWNGRFPTIRTITTDPEDQDCYLIDDAEDIAWLGNEESSATLGEGKTFRLVTNIDMGYKPGQKSVKLPAGSTFDGNSFTIKGLKTMTGLFGDNATKLTVRNLNIEDAIVSSNANGHKGILANKVMGSSSFTNVTITNSSVRTIKGSAGGMVGYISRISASDRAEQMEVVFDNCHLINTSIEADGDEGYFVGTFRGYDNGEKLIFKNSCSVIPVAIAQSLNSYIVEGNEAVWTAGTDFSRYNAWLGCEECCRGLVYFEGTRFIARWDGKKTVTPLLADPVYDDSAQYKVKAGTRRYVIYSAFDLAGARKASGSPMGLYFKTSVDMNGQGKDGKFHVPAEFSKGKCTSTDDNAFKRFTYVRDLDGQNNTIYNLYLHSKAVNDSAYVSAFINSVQNDSITVHKNLNMRNCCSVSPVIQREGAASGQDLSYGAIFLYSTGSKIAGSPTYTMDNIHIYDSKVFAVQHSGVLCGVVTRANISNSSVNNCYIENYKCTKTLEPFVKNVEIAGSEIEISANFYSYGEIGALFGNIRGTSTITNCHVRNSTVHAYSEPDKEADMKSDGLIGKLAIASAKGLGFYLVPGRHVSTMVGDIRTHNGETITINNCTVDSATKCTADHSKHNNSFPYIGQAYYIQFADTEGTVTVNGQKLTLADGNKKTDR